MNKITVQNLSEMNMIFLPNKWKDQGYLISIVMWLVVIVATFIASAYILWCENWKFTGPPIMMFFLLTLCIIIFLFNKKYREPFTTIYEDGIYGFDFSIGRKVFLPFRSIKKIIHKALIPTKMVVVFTDEHNVFEVMDDGSIIPLRQGMKRATNGILDFQFGNSDMDGFEVGLKKVLGDRFITIYKGRRKAPTMVMQNNYTQFYNE